MRTWFITGVSSGLGRALAVAVLAAGDDVEGTVRRAQAHDDFVALHPSRAHAFIMHVKDPDAVARVVQAADQVAGGTYKLMNNAGASLEGTIEQTGWMEILEQFRWLMRRLMSRLI